MRTSLRNPPMFHNVDAVTVPDRSQSVGNYHASRIAIDLRNCIFNAGFGDGIQIAGRFIQNQQLWFFQQRSGDCKSLSLSSGEIHPVFIQRRIVAQRQLADKFISSADFAHLLNLRIGRFRIAQFQIVLYRVGKQKCILIHIGDGPTQRIQIQFLYIPAIQ